MSTNTSDDGLTVKEKNSGPSGDLGMTQLVCAPQLLTAAMLGFSLLRSDRGLSLLDRGLILTVLILLGISYGLAIHTIRHLAHAMPSPSDQNRKLLSLVGSLLISLTTCTSISLMVLVMSDVLHRPCG